MRVERGDAIGFVGSTGNADARTPHLHFAIFELGPERLWWRGKAVNPYPGLVEAVKRAKQRTIFSSWWPDRGGIARSSRPRLFKMLPDAFVFGYAGDNGNMLKLNFRTNPDFHPPSMEARVFHYMEGEMWVDCKQERLTAFSGHLTRDVKFGVGLLGHLDKGGHFEVKQAEVVPGHWDLTNISVEITGKALLFATIGMRKKETHWDFHRVSDDLTLAEAADMLNRKIVVADSH